MNKTDLMRKWYKKGVETGKRCNPSGCCCKISDDNTIEEYCALHAADRDKILEVVNWYIECKETLYKVEQIYREFLDVGYDSPAYFELKANLDKAYKDLKNLTQKEK